MPQEKMYEMFYVMRLLFLVVRQSAIGDEKVLRQITHVERTVPVSAVCLCGEPRGSECRSTTQFPIEMVSFRCATTNTPIIYNANGIMIKLANIFEK